MSAYKRNSNIDKLRGTEFDLIIIGGGVTGAGIALDASARGLKVALIEKGDFASGTSSKSTKLIHGGLRYLKQMDFALVRESGTERAIVHHLAPHLVIPEKMLLPLVEGGSYGRFLTSLGLKLYDILANVEGEDRRQMLDKEEALLKEPLLKPDTLKGAGYYAEYRTDDARLTIELIKKAVSLGAICINYVRCDNFIKSNGHVVGAVCADMISGVEIKLNAKLIVSAAGPWVDLLLEVDGFKKGSRLHLTKGIHIVLPYNKLPVRQTLYFDVPDGRMIFAIPRNGVTYVGTTDTNYTDDIDNIRVGKEDVSYLLDAINSTFVDITLTENDITSSWAGLRPLIHEDGKSPSELSRKDEIFESESGLISIAGGKLTGYRKMAKRIVDLVYDKLEIQDPGCTTDTIKLTSNPIEDQAELVALKSHLETLLKTKGIEDPNIVSYLLSSYGNIALDIINNMSDKLDPAEALITSELQYCIENEYLVKASDFLVRRTGLLYFNLAEAKKQLPLVIRILKDNLDWDEIRCKKEETEMHKLFAEAITFV